MKVFLDTNVLIDVLVRREPFYVDSAAIWTLAEQGQIEGCVSVISFTNIFYIVRKLAGLQQARTALVLLRDSFVPVSCDADVVRQAIDANSKDFEDAVQYFSALRSQADCLVTRNPDHFPVDPQCPIETPQGFLTQHSFG